MTSTEKIIEVKQLSKHYGKFVALDNVTFDVYKGDVMGFLGPNGAGKSTTIRALLSLIQPSSGQIKLFGLDPQKNHNEIFSRIGCIVEKPDFYPFLSAEKNLTIFARISGAVVNKSKIHETIEFVGLKGREKDKVKGFSSGMKQRLGIAQTLLHNPDLIVLDEPTTGLDPQGIMDIRHLILQLRNEYNKTILLSSHQLSEIELIANRMVIINKGKTVIQGSVTELLNEQDVVIVFTLQEPDRAKLLLQNSTIACGIVKLENNTLAVQANYDAIPAINQLLCENGIKIFSIDTKRKLEDYFLKLINN